MSTVRGFSSSKVCSIVTSAFAAAPPVSATKYPTTEEWPVAFFQLLSIVVPLSTLSALTLRRTPLGKNESTLDVGTLLDEV
jgi:hypothetical protein